MEPGARTAGARELLQECRAAQETRGREAKGWCSPGRVPRLCRAGCDRCGSHTSQGR